MTRMNLVGVPRNDIALQTVGDFLTLFGAGVKNVVIKEDGEFRIIAWPTGPGSDAS